MDLMEDDFESLLDSVGWLGVVCGRLFGPDDCDLMLDVLHAENTTKMMSISPWSNFMISNL